MKKLLEPNPRLIKQSYTRLELIKIVNNLRNIDKVCNFFKSQGFKYSSGMYKKVWHHEKCRWVIKTGEIEKLPRKLPSKYKYLFMDYAYVNKSYTCAIQHKANLDNQHSAMDNLEDDVDEIECSLGINLDVHRGNVGHYRKRAIIFDW